MVKNLPAMQGTQVQFLGREDPLEKEMATHSSTIAWEIPWTEEPGGLQLWGRAPRKVRSVGESIKQTLVLGLDAREQGVS